MWVQQNSAVRGEIVGWGAKKMGGGPKTSLPDRLADGHRSKIKLHPMVQTNRQTGGYCDRKTVTKWAMQ